MNKSEKRQRIIVCILPFLLAVVCIGAAWFVINFVTLPECFFHRATGLNCPGCGNTRSIIALLHGDILLSLRENAAIIVAIIISAILYIEPVMKAFGKKDYRSPIRNKYFLIAIVSVFAVYCVVRNFIPAIAPIDISI